MTKRFRPWDPKQKWLLPPEITEFIAAKATNYPHGWQTRRNG
jgi:hypothetical protein